MRSARPPNGPGDTRTRPCTAISFRLTGLEELQGRALATEPAVPLTAGGLARMVAPTVTDIKTITARSCQLQRLVGRLCHVARGTQG